MTFNTMGMSALPSSGSMSIAQLNMRAATPIRPPSRALAAPAPRRARSRPTVPAISSRYAGIVPRSGTRLTPGPFAIANNRPSTALLRQSRRVIGGLPSQVDLAVQLDEVRRPPRLFHHPGHGAGQLDHIDVEAAHIGGQDAVRCGDVTPER